MPSRRQGSSLMHRRNGAACLRQKGMQTIVNAFYYKRCLLLDAMHVRRLHGSACFLHPQNLLGWDLSLNRQTFSFCPKIKGRLRLFQRLTQFLSFAVVLRLLAGNLRLWCKQQHPCDIPFRASGQGIFASRKKLSLFAASLP